MKEIVGLVTFAEETFSEKLNFLHSEMDWTY